MSGPLQIVGLHGFVGSGDDWDLPRHALAAAAPGLAVAWTTPDLPGHGANLPPNAFPYTVPAMAASVASHLRTLSAPPVLIGYSMGGRVALRLALDWPDLVGRLVLIGAHPGIADADERRARAAEDTARAARIREVGAAAFCAEWSRVPIIATQDRVPEPWRSAMTARRARNDTLGLALAAEVGGTGSMEPLGERLGDLAMPTLLVHGADDDKYGDLVAHMLTRTPAHVRPARIGGAGHAAHLEAADAFAARLASFLTR